MAKKEVLFGLFLKASISGFSNGQAMLPQLHRDLVKRRKWLSKDEFSDCVTMSRSLPGVFAINLSLALGSKCGGTKAGIMTVVATLVPPLCLLLLVASYLQNDTDSHWLITLLTALRPAGIALIAVAGLKLWKEARITLRLSWLPVIPLALCLAGIPPLWILLGALLGAFLFTLFVKPVDF